MNKKQFSDLFELDFVFNLRRFKITKITDSLIEEGYIPSVKAKQDIQKAQLDNYETEHALRNHFLK